MVVVILGVLLSVAVASYTQYKQRGNDQYGLTKIDEVLKQQQVHYLEFRRYSDSFIALGYQSETVLSDNDYFALSLAQCPLKQLSQCVLVTATPLTTKSTGQTFSVNTFGEKTSI